MSIPGRHLLETNDFGGGKYFECRLTNGCHIFHVFNILNKLNMLQEYFSELNKTGYTTTPVACGWAGAVMIPCKPRNSEIRDQK